MRSFLAYALAVLALCAVPVIAQAQTTTTAPTDDRSIADIRNEVDFLSSQMDNLRLALQRNIVPLSGTNIGDPYARLQLIEQELRRITSRLEVLEFQLRQVVQDGTARLALIKRQIAVLEGQTDSATEETPVLGGGNQSKPQDNLTIAEQQDFMRAKDELNAKNYATAAELFLNYTKTHPSSPKVAQAHYLRGESYLAISDHQNAGRGYLASFTSDPDSDYAPDALLKLGRSLAALDKLTQACRTLSELPLRYPDSNAANLAAAELDTVSCD